LSVKDQKSGEGKAVKVEPADVALLVRADPIAESCTTRRAGKSNVL
jgi:hypothetical protein